MMARQRVSILLLFFAVFGVALYCVRTPFGFTVWAFVFASPHLFVPVVIHRTQWVGVDPDFREIEPNGPDTPDAVLDEVRRTASQLEPLGFVLRGHYVITGLQAGIFRNFLSFWEHPRTRVLAKLAVMVNSDQKAPTLAIQTEYQDGTLFTTAYSRVLPATPAARSRPGSLVLPEFGEPRRLYEIHRALADPDGRSDVPIDDPVTYLKWVANQEFAYWVSRGYYYLDGVGARLRPTWKGAYLITWKFLPPAKKVRLALRGKKAARVLRELNLD